MRKLLTVLLSALMIISLVGCNETPTEPTVEESYAEKAARIQNEILDGIEPDVSVTGRLVVVTPNSNGEINAIRPGFTVKYPNVQLEIISLGTGDCLSRITAEKENPTIDVMWGGMNFEKWYNNQGLWEYYISPNEENITVNSAKAASQGEGTGYFTSYGLSGNTAFIINTEVLAECGLKPEDITGYQSLIDYKDQLKGKVLSGDPVKSSSAWQELVAMMYAFGKGKDSNFADLDLDAGWEYVKQFIEVIDGTVQSSSSAVYKLVVSGEYAIGVTYEDPALQQLKDEVENITMIYPEEANNWTPCAAAIVKGSENTELAKLFIDFLISEEGQKLYACTTLRTVTGEPNIVPNFLEFDQIPNLFDQDQLYIAANYTSSWKEKWTALLNEYNSKK